MFISYAHDSHAHAEQVRNLWIFLCAHGVDARIDRVNAEQRRDWSLWMERQVAEADRILIVASPAYKTRAGYEPVPSVGRGVQYEARLIRDLFYRNQSDPGRFLPVVLPGSSIDDVPSFLTPATSTTYRVSGFTVTGAEALLRMIHDRPGEIQPVIGAAPHLPTRDHTLTRTMTGLSRVSTAVGLPPRLTAAAGSPLVGRATELQTLREAWAGSLEGRSGLGLVSGEPGIGKTRLLAEIARDVDEQGGIVLYGRADDELRIPYLPLIEGLSYVLQRLPEPVLAGIERHKLAELARMSPELADLLPFAPTVAAAESDADRYQLFSAVAAVLRGLAQRSPVLVIVDDLHWADVPTVQLWRHLADRPLGRVLLLGAHRDSQITTGPLLQLFAELPPQTPVTRMTLPGLTPSEVTALAQDAARPGVDIGDRLAAQLHRDTNGNPFYLTAVLQHLYETGALTGPSHDGDKAEGPVADITTEVRLPPTVRDVLRARIARLGPAAERCLAVAAVIGQEFELGVLAAASGTDEYHTLDLLEAAARAALVSEDPTGPGRFRFVHSLVQHTLYQSLGRTRRAHTHARIADVLENLHGDDVGERIGELARHALAGIRPATAARAARHAQAAAERALIAAAPEEAIRWYTSAIAALEHSPDERARLSCRIGLGTAQRQAGDQGHRETLLAAGHIAQHLGETDLLVQAALACSRTLFSNLGQVDTEMTAVLEAALAVTATPAQRARLSAALAAELTFHPDFVRRRALADQAVQIARDSGDPEALFDALIRPAPALLFPDVASLRVSRLEEALDLAQLLGNPVARFVAAYHLALSRLEYANIDGIGELLASAQHDARDIHEPAMLSMNRFTEACFAIVRGDLDLAEHIAEDALAIGRRAGRPDAAAFHEGQLFAIRWHQGLLADRLPDLHAIAVRFPMLAISQAMCALAEAVVGERERAGQMLRAAAEQGFAFPYTVTWLSGLCLWADVAIELGDPDPAARLYDQLRPWGHLFATAGPVPLHATALSLAGLAALLGHHDRAHRHFGDALTIHQRMHSPFGIAITELHWGQLHLAQGQPAAWQHITGALELASLHGYHDVRRRAQDALASATRR